MFVGEGVELWTLQLSPPDAELSAEARRGRPGDKAPLPVCASERQLGAAEYRGVSRCSTTLNLQVMAGGGERPRGRDGAGVKGLSGGFGLTGDE